MFHQILFLFWSMRGRGGRNNKPGRGRTGYMSIITWGYAWANVILIVADLFLPMGLVYKVFGL